MIDSSHSLRTAVFILGAEEKNVCLDLEKFNE